MKLISKFITDLVQVIPYVTCHIEYHREKKYAYMSLVIEKVNLGFYQYFSVPQTTF